MTLLLFAMVGVVGTIAAGIVTARILRITRLRRQRALAAAPRKALLAFLADNGETGADGLVAIADDAWSAAEPGAVALLSKLRGEAHQALVTVFLRRGVARRAVHELQARSPVRRARAAEVLGNLELREAVPELCRLLDDRHRDVRVVAVRSLGRVGDPTAAWRLIACLDRTDAVPSLLVTHSLVQLGAEAQVTLSAALDHPRARVRAVCLDALGLLGAVGASTRMARVLGNDESLDVRVAAAVNLGKLGTRSVFGPLVEALAPDRPAPLRAAAAAALGDLGARTAIPHLERLLHDPAYRVAHEAANALRRLGPAGLRGLRRVAAGRDPGAEPAGPLLAGSAAAAHAREALALADIADPVTPAHAPDPRALAPTVAVAG